jgi:hypothetical protein
MRDPDRVLTVLLALAAGLVAWLAAAALALLTDALR